MIKVVELPKASHLNIPEQLRELAKEIEDGEYGEVHHLVWITSNEDQARFDVGLCGKSSESKAVAHFIMSLAQRRLEGDIIYD